MTELTQVLEELAEVDGDVVTVHTNKYGRLFELPYSYERFSDRDFGQSETLWLLFGAICEKVETEGWYFDMDNHGNPDDPSDKIKYSIIISSETRQLCAGYSESSLTHAAAKALLAALKAKAEAVHEG